MRDILETEELFFKDKVLYPQFGAMMQTERDNGAGWWTSFFKYLVYRIVFRNASSKIRKRIASGAEIHPIALAVFANLVGRRFSITGSRSIGTVPHTTQDGDLICILLGCSWPVVLR
ncbi:hypothetical protein ONS96_005816 [Cadophora gregata f. sp. sojae]|nr:hypothetical protein ONS96_005816 [Cadophora gregata f. sp. sojae]